MDELRIEIEKLFINNRRKSGNHQYTVPSPENYPYQWLWDSCFNAIILSHFDLPSAKAEIRSLISKQFENGLIPHIIYWERSSILDIDWGVRDTSTLTQPPLLAYALWRIYLKDQDKTFLEETYPALNKYYRYLLTRDPHGHHLVGIINPDESGEDNSPRFDIPLGLEATNGPEENYKKRVELFNRNKTCNFDAIHCMRKFFWVKDVPFASYMVENLKCMAEIAKTLGKEEDEAYMIGHANLMTEAMRKYLFEDGLFWSTYGPNYKKIKVKTWAIFAPLIANILTKKEASDLINKYFYDEKQFHSKFMMPTTAMDEKSFNTKEHPGPAWLHPNWRGPVWMAVNWLTYRGLKRYNFDNEAEKIRAQSLALLKMNGFREYFNPETGVGMGADNFTWGGLVLDMDLDSQSLNFN